jgi:GntR family transcriptional regulator
MVGRGVIMLNIDKQSGRPVYEQIIEQMQRLILVGSIMPDEQIPSVRSLSLELSVNPNTIQKAYNELEIDHITYSVPGVGRFVAKGAKEIIGNFYRSQLSGVYETSFWLALAEVTQSIVTDTVNRAYDDAKKHIEKRLNDNDKS